MNGARQYADLFTTGQYGKLYIVSGSHARGKTLHVQVLPEGEEAKPNGRNNLCSNDGAIEVYGLVSGNPGWTEVYGWLHEGPWQDDFYALVEDLRTKRTKLRADTARLMKETRKREEKRKADLLSAY